MIRLEFEMSARMRDELQPYIHLKQFSIFLILSVISCHISHIPFPLTLNFLLHTVSRREFHYYFLTISHRAIYFHENRPYEFKEGYSIKTRFFFYSCF